jgi:polyphosphate kinase 2
VEDTDMTKAIREEVVQTAAVAPEQGMTGEGKHLKKKKKKDKKKGKKNREARVDGATGAAMAGGNGDRTPISVESGAAPAPAEAGEDHGAKLSRKRYEKKLIKLQTELCKLQDWVVATGQRVVVVFEGRDAAGKGGMIRALTERVNPRVFRVVALPAPSDREKTQIYAQRYLQHFPAAGEVVIFDRSWYNRAGVERVMGFVSEEKYKKFLVMCPRFERVVIDNGILLVKYWLEVGNEEQKRRFEARIEDPLRQWKLSAMDLPSREKWFEYSRARDLMLEATDTDVSPWHIVKSDSKRRAHVNLISHFLSVIPYEPVKRPKVELPKRSMKHAYDDVAPMRDRRWIPEVSI